MPVASIVGVWRELSERYSEKADTPDEAIASIMVERAMTLLEKDYHLHLHPYRMLCGEYESPAEELPGAAVRDDGPS